MSGQLALLAQALCYVEEHLCEEITVADVAEACYCSVSALQKLFRYVTHYSMKEYIRKRRITCASRELISCPESSVLDIAVKYCYGSNEAFTRAFEQIWHCTPTVFRKQARFAELHPRWKMPDEKGEMHMFQKKELDISELYDLFLQRKECWFICCDIKGLMPINEISREAGDLAILTTVRRMEAAADEEDVIFRVGGDEFVLLTGTTKESEARNKAEKIRAENGIPVVYEGREIPLSLHVGVTRFEEELKYDELVARLKKTMYEIHGK
ncbi:MAG: helix-turn-helix domain-containing protein [Lachnospiraceae bacterium]|nr:helix-turn-helix domain-containing protein [Lachnospiraceae bacterium]